MSNNIFDKNNRLIISAPYIIAEAGVNHEGSLKKAYKLIDFAKKGGADAVSAINTIVAMGIDIQTFKPKLHTTFGGLSGPAIKPIALAHVHKIFKAVNIPIIGIGGISSATDVIEFILAGSDLVQVGTLNYRNPNIAVDIFNELKKYCVKNKIDSISDLKGKLKYYE